uniref:Putative ovule protein n=1 Tax=Solanum chacoense TaxID=4108 RepID=A0A0V0H5M2_SOLCH
MLYLTLTRPDIAFQFKHLVSSYISQKNTHWEAVVRAMRYVKREPRLEILLSSHKTNKLSVFCDADWASCPNTRSLRFFSQAW